MEQIKKFFRYNDGNIDLISTFNYYVEEVQYLDMGVGVKSRAIMFLDQLNGISGNTIRSRQLTALAITAAIHFARLEDAP